MSSADQVQAEKRTLCNQLSPPSSYFCTPVSRKADVGEGNPQETRAYPRYVDVEDAFAFDFRDEREKEDTASADAPLFTTAQSFPRAGDCSERSSSTPLASALGPHKQASARVVPGTAPSVYACGSSLLPESKWAGPAARREATLLALLLRGGVSTREVLEQFDDAEIDEEDAIFFRSSKNVLVVRRILSVIHSGKFAQNNIPDHLLERRADRPDNTARAVTGSHFRHTEAECRGGAVVLPEETPEPLSWKKVRFGPDIDTSCDLENVLKDSPERPTLSEVASGRMFTDDSRRGNWRRSAARPLRSSDTSLPSEDAAGDGDCCERQRTEDFVTVSDQQGRSVRSQRGGSKLTHGHCVSRQGGESEPGGGLRRTALKKRKEPARRETEPQLVRRCPKIIVCSSLWENLFLLGCFLEKHGVRCCHFYEKVSGILSFAVCAETLERPGGSARKTQDFLLRSNVSALAVRRCLGIIVVGQRAHAIWSESVFLSVCVRCSVRSPVTGVGRQAAYPRTGDRGAGLPFNKTRGTQRAVARHLSAPSGHENLLRSTTRDRDLRWGQRCPIVDSWVGGWDCR